MIQSSLARQRPIARRLPRSGNVLDFRSVLTGEWVLAGFDPQWPILNLRMA
jgi:hypothetical protein